MKMKFVFYLVVFSFAVNCFAHESESLFKYFFRPRPITRSGNEAKWDFKPTVVIPALKLSGSSRENAWVDAYFLTSAGGGVSLQRSIQRGASGEEKNYCTFAANAIILLSGDTSKTDSVIDVSPGITLGLLDNIIQFGAGISLGKIDEGKKRLFFLLSFGFNITNN